MSTARAFGLASVPLFRALPPDRLEQLDRVSTRLVVPRGGIVYRQGDPASHVYVVAAGTIGLGSIAFDGKRGLFTLAGEGESFGELAILESHRSHEAEAIERAHLTSIPAEVLTALVQIEGAAANALVLVLAEHLRRSTEALRDAMLLDVPGRLARRLCDLAASTKRAAVLPPSPAKRVPIPTPIGQQDLARLVGASRETVNRTLSAFARRGWVLLNGGRVSVVDAEALSARAAL